MSSELGAFMRREKNKVGTPKATKMTVIGVDDQTSAYTGYNPEELRKVVY